MERYLSKEGQEFLIGDRYTLADVYATVLCARICLKREDFMFGPKTHPYNPIFADKPNCKRWWERMRARPSYKKTPILTTLLSSKYAIENDTYIWYDENGV